MALARQPFTGFDTLCTRLSRLASLSQEDIHLLQKNGTDQRAIPARRELIREGEQMPEPRALLTGWACRLRILPDGRRQIQTFLLPGDLIGLCRHTSPRAATTVMAVTDVLTCSLPTVTPPAPLAEAFDRSAAAEEHHLYAQITRLGRLDARERMVDWLLETYERLALAGVASGNRFSLPITQEMLADTLGLTSVHVNRTLQALRRDGLLTWRGGFVALPDRQRLERIVNYQAARVHASGS